MDISRHDGVPRRISFWPEWYSVEPVNNRTALGQRNLDRNEKPFAGLKFTLWGLQIIIAHSDMLLLGDSHVYQ